MKQRRQKKTKLFNVFWLNFFLLLKVSSTQNRNFEYRIGLNLPKSAFSLKNRTLEIELPAAKFTYTNPADGESVTIETSERPVVKAQMENIVLSQGNWLKLYGQFFFSFFFSAHS